MRHKVKLTERELRNMISESVRRVLQEVTMNGTTSPYTNDFASDNRIAAHGYTHNSANMPDPSYDGIKKGDYYAAPNRDSSSMHKDIDNFNKKQKKNAKSADKRWGKSADSRPLHRKGSLNRAFEESRIRGIVRETLKRTLNEVSGWSLEKDDVTWVNDSEGGASDKAWMVRIWPGSGYYLPAFGAYATSEQDALEKVVAYLDQKGDDSFFCDEYVEEMQEELAQEGKDQEEIWEEIDKEFCYVDATMDGGECHYVYWENLSIYPYDEKRFAR